MLFWPLRFSNGLVVFLSTRSLWWGSFFFLCPDSIGMMLFDNNLVDVFEPFSLGQLSKSLSMLSSSSLWLGRINFFYKKVVTYLGTIFLFDPFLDILSEFSMLCSVFRFRPHWNISSYSVLVYFFLSRELFKLVNLVWSFFVDTSPLNKLWPNVRLTLLMASITGLI
jgi:hypothetical protein